MKSLSKKTYNDFSETSPETEFWTDGSKVYFGPAILRGANLETLLFEGIFAKDEKNVFVENLG